MEKKKHDSHSDDKDDTKHQDRAGVSASPIVSSFSEADDVGGEGRERAVFDLNGSHFFDQFSLVMYDHHRVCKIVKTYCALLVEVAR